MLEPRREDVDLTDAQLCEMYVTMNTIRVFEERVSYESSTGNVLGPTHLYVGQEAIATGICAVLRTDDYITSTHRGHGHAIAKGCTIDRMMAELFGRATGYCKGKGGSMHIADFSVGMLGANAIVAAGIPIGAGAGLGIQLKNSDQVVASFFGESASNRGPFHEGINLAAVWRLPVLFVCENNQYGQYTAHHHTMLVDNVADRASAYGIPGIFVDGNDVLAVYEAANEAITSIRAGNGPILLECKTYRIEGHNVGDEQYYRTRAEVDAWRGPKDPITRFRTWLLDNAILTEQQDTELQAGVQANVDAAVTFAAESPFPEIETALDDVFSTDYEVML